MDVGISREQEAVAIRFGVRCNVYRERMEAQKRICSGAYMDVGR